MAKTGTIRTRTPRVKKAEEPKAEIKVDEPIVEKEETGEEKTWRYLNRKPLREAHTVYDSLKRKYRELERDSRLAQAEKTFRGATELLKELKNGSMSQKAYEELYAEAWRKRAQLTKGEIYSDEYVTVMNRELLQLVGWTFHEYLEHSGDKRW